MDLNHYFTYSPNQWRVETLHLNGSAEPILCGLGLMYERAVNYFTLYLLSRADLGAPPERIITLSGTGKG
jgi:hypothetical protein